MEEQNFYIFEKDPEIIEVDINEWAVASYPNIIETKALGPCTGVIIYDNKKQIGVCGHIAEPRINLRYVLDKAKEIFPDAKDLEVYLGGQAPIDPPTFEEDKKSRNFVKNLLKEYGYDESQITTNWQDSHQVTTMKLDTVNNKVEYLTDDMWELINEEL